MSYFVFGCGNKNWLTNYQKVAKVADECLTILGAKRLIPATYFNDGEDELDEVFDKFYKVMAPRLMHSLPGIGSQKLRAVDASTLISSKTSLEAQPSSSAIRLVYDYSDETDIEQLPILYSAVVPANTKVLAGKLKKLRNQSLLASTDKYSFDCVLELPDGVQYCTGDYISVLPVNPTNLVDKFIELFIDFDLDVICKWTSSFENNTSHFQLPLNTPLSLYNILTHLLDIAACPSKQFLINLSTIVIDKEHMKFLQQIASDTDAYKTWLNEHPQITITDVVTLFPVDGNRFDRLLEIIPVLKPKTYPIYSSPAFHRHKIRFYVEDLIPYNPTVQYVLNVSNQLSLLKTTTNDKEKSHAAPPPASQAIDQSTDLSQVCRSREIAQKISRNYLHYFIRIAEQRQKLPIDSTKPLVIFSYGLGIAPLLGLLYDSHALQLSHKAFIIHISTAKKRLIKSKFTELQKLSVITEYYLIDRQRFKSTISQNAAKIWDLVNNQYATVYISGFQASVAGEAVDELSKIIQSYCTPYEYRGCSEYADAYITQLRDARRLEECWV